MIKKIVSLTREDFEHTRHIELLSNHLLEDDWVWLYKKEFNYPQEPSVFYKYWCYLAFPDVALRALSSYRPDIDEGIPCAIMADNSYKPYARSGFEHLTTIRDFKVGNNRFRQIRVSDELIYFHNLYEVEDNSIKRYYDSFDNALVCEVGPDYAKILNKYLSEFMVAKKMDLVCMAQSEIEYDRNHYTPDFHYSFTTEKGIPLGKLPNQNYNLMINPCFYKMRNWFNGKMVYSHKV